MSQTGLGDSEPGGQGVCWGGRTPVETRGPTGQCQIKHEYKCRVTVLKNGRMLSHVGVTDVRVLAANPSLKYSKAKGGIKNSSGAVTSKTNTNPLMTDKLLKSDHS